MVADCTSHKAAITNYIIMYKTLTTFGFLRVDILSVLHTRHCFTSLNFLSSNTTECKHCSFNYWEILIWFDVLPAWNQARTNWKLLCELWPIYWLILAKKKSWVLETLKFCNFSWKFQREIFSFNEYDSNNETIKKKT